MQYTNDDAEWVFELAALLFNDSDLFSQETIDVFREYSGFIIKNDAFLLYTEHDMFYIEFIGSRVKGQGTTVLTKFIEFAKEKNKSCYLHVERGESASRLINWYKRFGFVEYPLNPLLYPYYNDHHLLIIK